MEFPKLSAPSLKELFVKQMQEMILSGRLPVGTKLPPEREMARQMQVSRAVVNGGLAELARQGFLEVHPRRGTVVADYRRNGSLSTLVAIMSHQGQILGKEELDSISGICRALGQAAEEYAREHASGEDVRLLEKRVKDLQNAKTNVQAAEAVYEFWHEVALIGGNSVLPLVYASFAMPAVTYWERRCQEGDREVLYKEVEQLYQRLSEEKGIFKIHEESILL